MVRCGNCSAVFTNRVELHVHRNRHHRQYGGSELQPKPWDESEDVFQGMENGDMIRQTYEENDQYILAPNYREGEANSYFNFPINKVVQDDDIEQQMREIYRIQNNSYKVNISVGLILQEKSSNTTRYFKAAPNLTLLTYPLHIWNIHSLERSISKLLEMDINEYIKHFRPDSGYVVKFVTNLEYYVYDGGYVLGKEDNLPAYLRNSKSILTRQKMRNGQYLQKNMCFFSALAQSKCDTPNERVQASIFYRISALFDRWVDYCSTHLPNRVITSMEEYQGFLIDDIPHAEECYSVNINMLELHADGSACSRYHSMTKHDDTVYMNMYQNHISLITNVENYANRYVCQMCDRIFRRRSSMIRHSTTCGVRVKHKFPGGFFKYHKNLFAQLEEVGVNVPQNARFYKQFAVWDLEAVLQPIPQHQNDQNRKITYTHRHAAISFSVCSNVEGFTEPYTVVNPDPQKLVKEMFDYFDMIRQKAVAIAYDSWGEAYDTLVEKVKTRQAQLRQQLECITRDNTLHDSSSSEMEDEGSVEEGEGGDKGTDERAFKQDALYRNLSQLLDKLWLYIHQFIIVSFNGSKYDEHLIKRYLATYFLENKDKSDPAETLSEIGGRTIDVKCMGDTDMIKRSNAYLCIANRFYRMLDLCNYLPPATSYSAFLKAYDVKESKFIFPYEFLSNADKLRQTYLPPYPSEAWVSTLKQIDLLQHEYDLWVQNGSKGVAPKTGHEKYELINQLWHEKGWETMADYLKYYNSLDTGPMVIGVEKLMDSYMSEGIDIWKECLSTPGISRILLMKSAQRQNVIFPLVDEGDKDMFYMFHSQIAAGPSIVFTRDLHVDHTPLAVGSEEICKSISGYDCSSLYLAQMLHEMPSQSFVRRFREEQFKPRYKRRYLMMYVWLQYKGQIDNIHIKHRFNQGFECKIGPYYADGLSVQDGVVTIYDYLGCFWHCHCSGCGLNTRTDREEMDSIHEREQKRHKWIIDNGYKHVTIWECEMVELLASNPELKTEYNAMLPTFFRKHRTSVTEHQILNAVKNGDIFGFFIVDIHTPEHLQAKFHRFPPLFCNSKIGINDIGPHMRQFVEDNNINFKCRRLLISAMSAKDILLSSPLLQWYLQHGLIVTKIEQVIEFAATKPFEHFVNDITHHRQQADKDPNRRIIAQNKKITGNAAYGSLILNKQKYTKTKNVDGLINVKKCVNQANFKALTTIGDELYQVDTVPTSIKMDLPSYLGLWILLYAKLRMLQFVVDFVDKYIIDTKWILGQMDTDSVYWGLSEVNLIDAVKPELRNDFHKMTNLYCGPHKHPDCYIPRSCCNEHNWLDSRTPNMFKLEWTGKRLISLNSKTYVGVGESDLIKLSSKGVSTALVRQSNPLAKYESVLRTRVSSSGVNRGFKLDGQGVQTYIQSRLAFSYLYVKRIVENDGIHTKPLQVTLNPVPIDYFCIQTDGKILGADFKYHFRVFGRTFTTIRQAISFMAVVNNRQSQSVQNQVTNTSDPNKLLKLCVKSLQKQQWVKIRNSILEQIVTARMTQLANARIVLESSGSQTIVNACDKDMWLGIYYNARVLRWVEKGHLAGQNQLGNVYSSFRDGTLMPQ